MALVSIQGGKKEPCMYCGKDPHAAPLACPRILCIDIDPECGCVVGITFRDMPPDDDEPQDAA